MLSIFLVFVIFFTLIVMSNFTFFFFLLFSLLPSSSSFLFSSWFFFCPLCAFHCPDLLVDLGLFVVICIVRSIAVTVHNLISMFHVIFIVISIFDFDVDLDRPVHLFFVRWLKPQLLNAHPHIHLPLGRRLHTI